MIKCEELYEVFEKNGLLFFTGVPDSTFKDWMKFLADEHGSKVTNVIACNECEAIAVAAGHHLATGGLGVAYMQNAGEGKTINPLTSLCDPEVYSIPMLLMIGWRGEPGKKDEPQHKKMGRVTMSMLDVLEVPYKVLPDDVSSAALVIAEMKELALKENKPVALIIKKGSFEKYEAKKVVKTDFEMGREDAIKLIVNNLDGDEAIISTTGKTSRELFEHRVFRGETPCDFYTVGSMGCCSSIALGIALEKPDKKILVFDGDGAVIMQLGSLATIGHYKPKNLIHVVFDNTAYDSTGGQPTVSPTVEFEKIALACGYKSAKVVDKKEDVVASVKELKASDGPHMLIVNVNKGARADLGRPTTTPIENKKGFMDKLVE